MDVGRLQELYGLLYRGGKSYLPRVVLTDQLQRSAQVIACAAHPVFHFGERSGIEAARRVFGGPRRPAARAAEAGAGTDGARRGKAAPVAYRRVVKGARRWVPARVTLQAHAEQAPNPDSRVTLSERRDRLGVPLAKVDWRLTELDRRTAQAMVERWARSFAPGPRRCAGRPLARASTGRGLGDSFHHMGTTRMGATPAPASSTRRAGPRGGGLFVAGSSVFPAGGHANPTLTIAALAIRLSDHLKDVLDVPRYFLDLPEEGSSRSWDPHSGPHPERADTRYFGGVFREMEKTLVDPDLDIHLTWDSERLPDMGIEWWRSCYATRGVASRATAGAYGRYSSATAAGRRSERGRCETPAPRASWSWLSTRCAGCAGSRAARPTRGWRPGGGCGGGGRLPRVHAIPLGTYNQVDLPMVAIEERATDLFFAGSVDHGPRRGGSCRPRRAPGRDAGRRAGLGRPHPGLCSTCA